MIAEDILNYVKNQIPFNYFIGELPVEESDTISFILAPSANSNYAIDYYEQSLDIWGRFKSTREGYDKMRSIFKLLHAKGNYQTDNYHIYFSSAIGNILDMDRDTQRRKLYKMTIRFIYRELEVANQ